MKKILLFIIISIVTLSAPNLSNNQNSDKSVAELQFKIEQLEKRLENYEKLNWELERSKKDINDLNLKVESRVGLIYNIDQIYSTASKFYETSLVSAKELYEKSFLDLKNLVYQILIIGTSIFLGLKWWDKRNFESLKKEVLEQMETRFDNYSEYIKIQVKAEAVSIVDETKLELKNTKESILNDAKKEIEHLKNKIEENDKSMQEVIKAIGDKLNENNTIPETDIKIEEYKEGVDLINQNRNNEAISKLIEALKKSKTDIEKYYSTYWLGIAYYNTENFKEAIKELKKAKEMPQTEDNKYYSTYWLGMSYYNAGEFKEAIKEFKESVKLSKTENDKYFGEYWLGISYYNTREFKEAIKEFKEAIKLAKSEENKFYSKYWLGVAFYNDGNFKEAIKELEVAVSLAKLEKDKYYSTYWLGMSYFYNENFDLGKKNLKKAVNIATTNSDEYYAKYWLAMVYNSIGNLCDMKNILESIKDINHENRCFVNYFLAEIYYKEKNKKDASILIKEALRLKPDYIEAIELKRKINEMLDNLENKTEE